MSEVLAALQGASHAKRCETQHGAFPLQTWQLGLAGRAERSSPSSPWTLSASKITEQPGMPTLSMSGERDQGECVERRLGECRPKGICSMDLS